MTRPKMPPVAKEMLDDLQRLVEAIDRRVPHLERLSEAAIAKEAAELRQRAVTLIRTLKESVESK